MGTAWVLLVEYTAVILVRAKSYSEVLAARTSGLRLQRGQLVVWAPVLTA